MRPMHDGLTRQCGPAVKLSSGAEGMSCTCLTPAADTILAPIVGQPPALPRRLILERFTRPSGPAAKWSSAADSTTTPSIRTPAADIIRAPIVEQPGAPPTAPARERITTLYGRA